MKWLALVLIASGGNVEQNIKVATDPHLSAAARLKAVKSLADSKSEAAIAALAHELPRTNGELKEGIQRALASLGATGYFAKQLQSSDVDVRVHAAEMIALVPGGEGFDPVLHAMTSDGDAKVRELAAAALWRFQDRRALAPLVNALSSDSISAVRMAAAQSVAHLGGPEAKAALEHAKEKEKDAFVRIVIDESLKKLEAGR